MEPAASPSKRPVWVDVDGRHNRGVEAGAAESTGSGEELQPVATCATPDEKSASIPGESLASHPGKLATSTVYPGMIPASEVNEEMADRSGPKAAATLCLN